MSQEVPLQSEVAAPSQEGIQSGLADRAEAIKAVAQARENLGQVAAGHEVNVDTHGNVLLPREVQAIANGDTEAKA